MKNTSFLEILLRAKDQLLEDINDENVMVYSLCSAVQERFGVDTREHKIFTDYINDQHKDWTFYDRWGCDSQNVDLWHWPPIEYKDRIKWLDEEISKRNA